MCAHISHLHEGEEEEDGGGEIRDDRKSFLRIPCITEVSEMKEGREGEGVGKTRGRDNNFTTSRG